MKVRIYQPHTHAGVLHVPGPAGIELDVSQPDAEFLQRCGVLDPPGGLRTISTFDPTRVVDDNAGSHAGNRAITRTVNRNTP